VIKLIYHIVMLLLFSSILLFSQGGSNYSAFGVGELHQGIGAAYDGLGGSSIAVPYQSSITNKNPAQWSFLRTTRVQAGYRFSQMVVENENNTLWQNNGKIDGVLMNFCIDTSLGANVNLGFSAYSSVNFLVSIPVHVDDCGEGINGLTMYQGLGGLSQGWLGMAIEPFDGLSLGASVFTIFGNIQKTATTILFTGNTNHSSTYLKDGYNSVGMRFGFVAEPVTNLFLGGYAEISSDFKTDRNIIYESAFLGDSTVTLPINFEYPTLYGLGFSYILGEVMIAADFLQQDFTNLDYNRGGAEFRKYQLLSVGFARIGQFGYQKNFFDRTTYMIGAGYKKNYMIVGGTPIDEYFGSFGISAPLVGFAVLDAAFQFGVRGTTDNGLIKESFGRFTLAISLGDVWFKPFRGN